MDGGNTQMIMGARGKRGGRRGARRKGGRGVKAAMGNRLGCHFGLLTTHCHSLKSRYHLAAIESRVRRPSL